MGFNDALYEAEAYPGAATAQAGGATAARALKGFKDAGGIGWRDAHARV